MVPLFDAPGPNTAALSLSVDRRENLWVYGGIGRHLSQDDKSSTDQQYLFGIKDPFYNKHLHETGSPAYYHSYSNSLTLAMIHLFDTTGYSIRLGRTVYEANNNLFGTFYDLRMAVSEKHGWIRNLTESGERAITKPAIYGGISFSPSFTPNDDVCGYRGNSRLYALFYETGIAYPKPVLSSTGGSDPVADSIDLGPGLSSSPAIHQGKDEDTVFLQQSTGQVLDIEFDPIFKPKSGLISWQH